MPNDIILGLVPRIYRKMGPRHEVEDDGLCSMTKPVIPACRCNRDFPAFASILVAPENAESPMAYLLEEHRPTPLAVDTKHTYLGNGDVFVARALAIRFATRDEAETKRAKLPNPDEWIIVET